ncbi:MAG TPA: hypothetical protein PLQ93_04850 [Bacteroidia bacterium]|nr:hypothetical protein [Bacteroidia bacterium]
MKASGHLPGAFLLFSQIPFHSAKQLVPVELFFYIREFKIQAAKSAWKGTK